MESEQKKQWKTLFKKQGFLVCDHFFSSQECEKVLNAIKVYQSEHPSPLIHCECHARPLHYSVITGEEIEMHLPEIIPFYLEATAFVNDISEREMKLVSNKKVAINVNIMSQGGSYQWHYDRNAITIVIYLNIVMGK